MQTEKNSINLKNHRKPYSHALTFGILERLLLYRRLHEQIEVLALIGVRYHQERLRRAVTLRKEKKRRWSQRK